MKKMKKISCFLFAGLLMLSLAGCTESAPSETESMTQTETEAPAETVSAPETETETEPESTEETPASNGRDTVSANSESMTIMFLQTEIPSVSQENSAVLQ